jgi:putative PIN family toxin of toxin-antitoxin system
MSDPSRVVFDCNVYFQALTSPGGPARRLLTKAAARELALVASEQTLVEVADVASRPYLVRKYGLDPLVVERFLADIRAMAEIIDPVPHVFDLPRDPDDAHYIDLAVAASARLVVSRDKDLLALRDTTSPEGRDFAARFPGLEIVTPPELLSRIESAG